MTRQGQGFIKSNQSSFSVFYRLLDVAFILLLLLVAASAYGVTFSLMYLAAGLIGSSAFSLLAESMDLYRSWRAASTRRLLATAASVWCITCALLLLLGFFAKVSEDVSRVVIGSWMLSVLVVLCGWRFVFRQVLFLLRAKGYNTRNVAIAGLTTQGIAMREQLLMYPELGMRFAGFFDDRSAERTDTDFPGEALEGSIADLIERTQNGEFDLIFIALPLKAQQRINDILQQCGDTTASVHIIPDFFTFNLLHARLGSVGSMQTISVYDSPIRGINDVAKRIFDVSFSLLVLTVIAIPMLFIALAVKLTSPGPVIFKQYRYGLDGRRIQVWKFRSMTSMDNGSVVKQATKGDARITPFGAFIRRTSLDELPQFINVLQGRMSVVGPRPHAVAHNEEYRKLIPYYMLRHKVKPGITGWAQINGYRGETDTLDKMSGRVDYDLDYIRNWSLWLDIKIVFLTVFKGFTGSHVH